MKQTFAANLKNLRKELNLTQTALAEKIFVNKSMISAYEKGTRMPSLDALIQLSITLNVSVDYLLGVQRDNTNDKEKYMDISGLNDKQRKIVADLIDTFREQN